MDVKKLLADVTALPGVSGHEAQVSAYFAEQFRPLVDEVTVGNVQRDCAQKGQRSENYAVRPSGRNCPDGNAY